MNLVEQIFAQAQAGSADGAGFGPAFFQGAQLEQDQQRINMQKQELAQELAVAPLKQTLLQQESAFKAAQTEQLLYANQTRVQSEQAIGGLAGMLAKASSEATPVDGLPLFLEAISKNPRIMGDERVQRMWQDYNTSVNAKIALQEARNQNFAPSILDVPNPDPAKAGVQVLRKSPGEVVLLPGSTPPAPSSHEKDFTRLSALQQALSDATAGGDPAAIATAKRNLDTFGAMVTPPTQTVYDAATGNPIFTSGKPLGGLTTAATTQLQEGLQAATTSIDIANRLEPLISSETVGVRAFAGSVLKDRVLAQFFPGVTSQNRATAEVLSAQLRASTIKQLKSDGNISERERQQILQAVPGINAPADSADHARDLIQSARKVSAIQAIVSASKLKATIPAAAALALPWEEIVRLAKTGVLTPGQATAAYDAQIKARGQQ